MSHLIKIVDIDLTGLDYGEVSAFEALSLASRGNTAIGPGGERLVLKDCGAIDNTCLLLSVLYSLFGRTEHFKLCRAVCAFGIIANAPALLMDVGREIDSITNNEVAEVFEHVITPEVQLLRTLGSGLEAPSASAAAIALGVKWDTCRPLSYDEHWPDGAASVCIWHTGQWHYIAGLRIKPVDTYKPVFDWSLDRISSWLNSKLAAHMAAARAS